MRSHASYVEACFVYFNHLCKSPIVTWVSSFRVTMSPTQKFLSGAFHFCLSWRVGRNFFLQWLWILLLINLLSANIKESVFIFFIISIWMARLVKHVKRALYRFNVFLLSLMRNGPNMSTPQWVNWGYSFNLSCGRSAIICSPTFPRSLLLVKHLEIIFYTAELLCITQNLEDLISLRVMFLQLCEFSDDTTLLTVL